MWFVMWFIMWFLVYLVHNSKERVTSYSVSSHSVFIDITVGINFLNNSNQVLVCSSVTVYNYSS